MSETFIVANHTARQFISPAGLGWRDSCPDLLFEPGMQTLLTLLTTESATPRWAAFRQNFHPSVRGLLGSWTGGIALLGGYADADERDRVFDAYEDVSLRGLMLVINCPYASGGPEWAGIENLAESPFWFGIAERILELEPDFIIPELQRQFGDRWEDGYYKMMAKHAGRTQRRRR